MNSVSFMTASMAAFRLTAKSWTPALTRGASKLPTTIPVPKQYEDVELPEKPRLRTVQRVPDVPTGVKPPKMPKRLGLMRGPELVHNSLIHNQYGVIALTGGRMKVKHFEMVRTACIKRLDKSRTFAIWRIEHPWQPLFKKGIGHKMGGGKGGINEYCTPFKRGQVIIEVGGRIDYDEVKRTLEIIAEKLPFRAIPVNEEIMAERAKNDELVEKLNKNKWNLEYIFKNQMGNTRSWIRRQDFFHFGKYL